MNGLYIHSTASFLGNAEADINYLTGELRRLTPDNFRRLSRFILLALLGARRCIEQHSPAEDAAVYLTTELGGIDAVATALDEIYKGHSLPKPFNFINTMSNTATFYLARNLGIRGRSITVSSRDLSFERGLELLKLDFTMGTVKSALLGSVDETLLSQRTREEHTPRGRRVLDGSAWFYIASEKEGACGAFTGIRSFSDGAACRRWFKKGERGATDVLAFGALISDDESATWRETLRPAAEFDYLHEQGYSGAAAACGASLFVKSFPGRTMMHVNRDRHGRHTVLEVESFAEPQRSISLSI